MNRVIRNVLFRMGGALCVAGFLLGFQEVSAQTDVQIVNLHILNTQDPTECGPMAPASIENVGHIVLRFNSLTPPPVEHVTLLQGGLPNADYSLYVVRDTPLDPCDFFIKSGAVISTNSNGIAPATLGTLGTVVMSGDRIAFILITPPPPTFEPGAGPFTQIIQSEFVTVP